jgi:hypothetical protein
MNPNWSIVLLEKLTITHLLKELEALSGIREFIIMLLVPVLCQLSQIRIFFFHLRLVLSGLSPSDFPTESFYTFLFRVLTLHLCLHVYFVFTVSAV